MRGCRRRSCRCGRWRLDWPVRDRRPTAERIRRAAARVWPQVLRYASGDLDTALSAAPLAKGAEARVLVLSGTGSCCFARTLDGRAAKVGGRGHIIGDRGSACDIGQRALKALMAHYDHTGKWPKLGQHILSSLVLNEPDDLIPWSIDAKKTDIAALATSVFAAAKERDALAQHLLKEAAQSLAADGHACAQRVCKRSARVQFVFNGGVLIKNPSFAQAVAKQLKSQWPNAIITKVQGPSAWVPSRSRWKPPRPARPSRSPWCLRASWACQRIIRRLIGRC